MNENFFPADKMVFPPTTTDADGIARIVIPDDEALLNAGYAAARLESLREALRQGIISVRLHVDHPAHPKWEGEARPGSPTVVLPDSSSIVVRARRALTLCPHVISFPFWVGHSGPGPTRWNPTKF